MYLATALWAEGPTDYSFLQPLLRRVCDDLCARKSRRVIEIGEVLALDVQTGDEVKRRSEQIIGAARASSDGWHLLFIHADADARSSERARSERVVPALEQLESLEGARGGVGVIPVRMTDTWVLADSETLCRVMGTTLPAKRLGVPASGKELEALEAPKHVLEHAWRQVHGGRRRRRVGSIYALAGEQARLNELRKLTAFRVFERELENALVTLHYL